MERAFATKTSRSRLLISGFDMHRRINTDKLSLVLFITSLLLFSFFYGFSSAYYQFFPFKPLVNAQYKVIDALPAVAERIGLLESPFKKYTSKTINKLTNNVSKGAYAGLNLVTYMGKDEEIGAKIVDMQGNVVHSWAIDWFDIWPDATHVNDEDLPKSRPGTHIHGAVVLNNGDLVFNFEHLGLVRMAKSGEVVWKLPYRTHHSIHLAEDGNLWVCGQINHFEKVPRFPNYDPPFIEPTLLEVTPDGEIIREISVFDLLMDNGYWGLLCMSTLVNGSTNVAGDTLHLNDVEPFPPSMWEGFFKHGDVLVSLRNINTIFVFELETGKIKYISTGKFVRQHDPDFVDGNTISVFDNNNISSDDQKFYSRIVIVKFPQDTMEVYFQGSEEFPFFTEIMGKHQWLPNGNLLITESLQGRAFEIDKDKKLVWEYFNLIDTNEVALMEEVQRLPRDYVTLF